MALPVQNKLNPNTAAAHPQVGVTLIPNHSLDIAVKGKNAVNTYHSLWRSTLRFLDSAEGLFRVGQLMDKVPKWINVARQEYGMEKSPILDGLSGKGLTAWTWGTTFPRIVCLAQSAVTANQEARAALSDGSTPEQAAHKNLVSIRDTISAMTMSCRGVSMVLSLFPQGAALTKVFTTTAETVTLAYDGISFDINTQNLKRAYSAELKGATAEIKEILDQTKTCHWIATARDVCSGAVGIFGVLFIATGVAIVSGIAMVTLSLTATILAVTRKLYEEQMHCKPINFSDRRHATLLAT